MPIELSKTQIAVALAAAAASFFVVGEIMHQSRASTMATRVADTAAPSAAPTSPAAIAAMPAPRLDARSAERPNGARAACRDDVQRLCGDVASGQGRIVRCLAERRSEISAQCRSAMQQRQLDRRHRRQAMLERPRAEGAQLGQGVRQAWREQRMRRSETNGTGDR
jgi:Cysteine rich repeat